MQPVELLAPAGGPEQLRAALRYGADAVYLGLRSYGLRAAAHNFDEGELSKAARSVHRLGKRLYVTLNALLVDEDLPGFLASARVCADCGVDAVIVSDPGGVALLRSELPGMPLHLSTQASTLNSAAAALWHRLGVSRIIVGRELSLAGIAEMRRRVPLTLELEAFVHGAMCMAHSGRCLISGALRGRSANRGACAQPCRWAWSLSEQGDKAGQSLPVLEDRRGTYVLSAGDLCMLPHLAALVGSGLSSLKIEGRMKSEYYVATVVGAYRRALDQCLENPEAFAADAGLHQAYLAELRKASHRSFDTGFFFGPPEQPGGAEGFTQEAEFLGKVLSVEAGEALVQVRNRFFVGDRVECLSPQGVIPFEVAHIRCADTGEVLPSINRPGALVHLPVPCGVGAEDLLRGKVRSHVQGTG